MMNIYKIFNGISVAFLIKGLSGVLTFLMFLVIARTLSIEEFGVFGVGFSIAIFTGVVSGHGLDTLILRLWPEHNAKKNKFLARSAAKWATKKTFITSLLVSFLILLLFIIAGYFNIFTNYYNINFGISVACLSLMLALSEIISATLRVQNRLILALLPKDILWRLFIILILLTTSYLNIKINASQIIFLSALILLTLSSIQIFFSNLKNIFIEKSYATNKDKLSWSKLSETMWLTTVVFASTIHADMLLISFFISPETIASYFAALKIASVLALPLTAVNQLSGPMISEHFYSNEKTILQEKLKSYLNFCMLIIIPLIIFIMIYGRELLYLFNPEYSDAYYVLLCLTFGYFFHCITGPASIFLQMSGKSSLALKTSITTQGATLVIFPLAASFFGIIGIAIIRALEIILRKLIQTYFVKKIFGIHTSLALFFSGRI